VDAAGGLRAFGGSRLSPVRDALRRAYAAKEIRSSLRGVLSRRTAVDSTAQAVVAGGVNRGLAAGHGDSGTTLLRPSRVRAPCLRRLRRAATRRASPWSRWRGSCAPQRSTWLREFRFPRANAPPEPGADSERRIALRRRWRGDIPPRIP